MEMIGKARQSASNDMGHLTDLLTGSHAISDLNPGRHLQVGINGSHRLTNSISMLDDDDAVPTPAGILSCPQSGNIANYARSDRVNPSPCGGTHILTDMQSMAKACLALAERRDDGIGVACDGKQPGTLVAAQTLCERGCMNKHACKDEEPAEDIRNCQCSAPVFVADH